MGSYALSSGFRVWGLGLLGLSPEPSQPTAGFEAVRPNCVEHWAQGAESLFVSFQSSRARLQLAELPSIVRIFGIECRRGPNPKPSVALEKN